MRTRIYSRQELEWIFAKATELEFDVVESLPSRDGYSLSEVKAIAAEAGIDPALVERAARAIGRPGDIRSKGLISRQAEISLPITLSEDRARRVLSAIRSSTRQQGTGEASPSGFSWRSDGGNLVVTAHEKGGETHLKVFSRAAGAVSASGLLGVVAAWVTAGTLEPITMGVALGSVTAGLGVSAALATAALGKARREAACVLAAAFRTIMDFDDTSDRPSLQDPEDASEPTSIE